MSLSLEFYAWRSDRWIKAGFWFRVCGYGLHVMRSNGCDPLPLERAGYIKPVYVFGLRIVRLTPEGTA